MKSKTIKTIFIVALMIMLTLFMANTVAAFDGFKPIVAKSSNLANITTNTAGQILGVVQIIGMATAVIMLIILGIKYISAAPNEKADLKKGMTIYVVGAILLFGASVIIGFIKDFAKNLS